MAHINISILDMGIPISRLSLSKVSPQICSNTISIFLLREHLLVLQIISSLNLSTILPPCFRRLVSRKFVSQSIVDIW
ncbi:MAG: hypothetical protein ACOVOR_01525 [Rhabdochlamydiaceae bacterium]